MKLKFKPEDFKEHFGNTSDEEIYFITRIANYALVEMLLRATVVYGRMDTFIFSPNDLRDEDTHKALLINIEPIVKEPCKHEPEIIVQTFNLKQIGHNYYTLNLNPKCKHCGVYLVAEWKAK